MAEFTDNTNVGANTGETPSEGWFCTELQYAPEYQQGNSKTDGGYAVLSGPGASFVQILEVREIHQGEENTVQADPGWGCRYSQPAGTDEFNVSVTLLYTP